MPAQENNQFPRQQMTDAQWREFAGVYLRAFETMPRKEAYAAAVREMRTEGKMYPPMGRAAQTPARRRLRNNPGTRTVRIVRSSRGQIRARAGSAPVLPLPPGAGSRRAHRPSLPRTRPVNLQESRP